MIGKVINYTNQQQVSFTSVTTNTCPQRLFSSVQTCGLVNINQPLPWFSCIGQEKILSCFLEHFLCLCNILLQDLTPLHVKITRGTYLLSVCRRKLKLTTYWHTVSYNYISFLNKSSQLVWVLGTAGSSRFFSITWRMISRNSFSKTVYNVRNVRHLLCTIFVRKTTCQKYSFQILSQKMLRLWISKILTWIWWGLLSSWRKILGY